ncbi:hypothetical protein Asppvi_010741 [Aspergillus pseudoviridinutans]|uniref:Fibronectin type-III domain-containing protein n=1 Tax=Aspergillus pseudoviridinutans TaxID=1517512 RepID=A0A9P3BMS6_9EURO|nr:uncharacterized protein Asppvi_010741 [Aspergillus pseudoviridinutans]GIJ91768.1 hypothetical protein Asppvi_010741 [Aspergillus pseudoviridinutans]
MKVLLCLAALLLLAAAIPPPNSTENPLGGRQITDPNVLAELQARHEHILAMLKDGERVSVPVDELTNYMQGSLRRRVLPFVVPAILGLEIAFEAGRAGTDIIGGLFANLLSVFTKDEYNIWTSTDHCRTYFQTHSGSEGLFQTWARDSQNPDTNDNMYIAWINPQTTAPPIYYFENDFLGKYSVQFTATDQVAWSGINDTEKCPFEGICNPQYIFYHNGYSIILNTWQSQGYISACQYSHGGDCRGLCSSGVRDQFSQNGVVWGGNCALPCKTDGGDGYTVQPDPPKPPKPSAKVMVVGDSISHGMEADWTWRWRIFAWLQDNLGYDVSFVGPWFGTHGPGLPQAALPQPPLFPGETAPEIKEVTGLYADGVPGFFGGSHHASWWGRQVAQSKDTIKAWVKEHQPDYLFVLLGFNDLGWFVSGPEDLVGNMGALVENAREGKPDVKILLGNVVHRSFIKGRQDLVDKTNTYNKLLRDRYPSWFRYESPIAYVDVNANYNCRPEGCPDGYDGLHPNSMGEYHIAQAFARSLKADFGFQGPDFVVPANPEPRVVSTPTGVQTFSFPEGLQTVWNRVPTARGYDIRSRVQGMTSWWSEGQVFPDTIASWSTWLLDGQTWEFQVRTRGDNGDVSGWSEITKATTHLQTSPGPPNIVAVPSGADGIQLSWGPVTGYSVNRYGVIVWDRDTEGAFIEIHAASGTSLFVGGLKPGHRYATWVATYVNLKSSVTGQPYAAGGLPAAGLEVIVGAGAPAPPTNLAVTNVDPTTVQLRWTASAGASGYAVYVRSVRDNKFNPGAKTTATTYGVAFLFPGTWNYEFCVSAFNGNLETAHTACVIPPVYPGYSKRDEVQVSGNSSVVTNTSPVYNSTYNSTTMIEDKRLPMLLNLLAQSGGNSSIPLL